jgi:NADPH:quinone reductase-like Zn-dependent oxidoreductase
MQAVVVREHGGYDELRLEDRPVPEPGPGEVRVRVRAAGVNQLDTWVRRGVPGHTFPLPLIPGADGAGEIDALGPGVRDVEVGTAVVILPGVSCSVCESCQSGFDQLCRRYQILGEARDGTCAEFVVVPLANIAPKPARLDFAHAASFALAFQTAWSMLVRKAELRAGETVLVQAAGSGVGSAAVQIARLLGASVIATAGSAAKCKRALELGADHAIDYSEEDVAGKVRALTGKRGCEVVFEHVGEATWEGSLRSLAWGGRLVTCGATTGADVPLNLRALFFKNLSILGSTMGSKGDLRRIIHLVNEGRLRPIVDRRLPLREVGKAHELLADRAVFGKIVLEPGR